METQHKSKLMRAYLLGLLPDNDTTALEEEYFVDRQSFHRIQAEESSLIADYLDGRLHKKEKQLFEGRYLRVPELHRKVEEVRQQRVIVQSATGPSTWIRWVLAFAGLVLVLGGGIWGRHFLRKQSDSASRSQPLKEKSLSPVQPQKPSVAKEQESRGPLVSPLREKGIASVRQRKNHAVRAGSLEDYLFADAKPENQSPPADATSQAPVELASVSSNATQGPNSPSAPTPHRKRLVAVLDFDYGTVQSYVSSIYGANQDVGKGITDMLVEKLVKDGKYSVIERKALDKILAEQNFSNSDRANPATAAKIGQLLGVDAVIMGSVTKFGGDDKSKAIGGAGLSSHGFGIGGIKRNEAKAVCAISARLVDTTTGEILAAVTGEGESKRSGTSLLSTGGRGGGAGGGVFNTHASNFGQTLLGEAVTQAVTEAGSLLGASIDTRKVEVTGVVTNVSGNTLIINMGSKTGLKVGDVLQISHDGEIKDSTTEKVLKTTLTKIGEGTVTEIDADSATLTFSGTRAAKVGDVAKTPD